MERWTINMLLMITLVLPVGCYYDNEEDLYPPQECITTNMSYQANIVPILERNCYVCHAVGVANGGVVLEGHANLVFWINNNRLLGAIRHESGFSAMPQNAAKLLDCDIAKIEQWIADGTPNN